MVKRTVFSLDYDGHGSALFPKAFERGPYKSMLKSDPSTENIFLGVRKGFHQWLNETAADSLVDLYVGSNRQDINTDRENLKLNRNGSCFANYELLAEDKGWTFQGLLLADRFLRSFPSTSTAVKRTPLLPPGTAMKDASIDGPFDKTKVEIIKQQLLDTTFNHPGDEIDFYFSDDDYEDQIIPALESYFSAHPEAIPPGITLHLFKLDVLLPLNKYLKETEPGTAKDIDTVAQEFKVLFEEKAILRSTPPLAAKSVLPHPKEMRRVSSEKTEHNSLLKSMGSNLASTGLGGLLTPLTQGVLHRAQLMAPLEPQPSDSPANLSLD